MRRKAYNRCDGAHAIGGSTNRFPSIMPRFNTKRYKCHSSIKILIVKTIY